MIGIDGYAGAGKTTVADYLGKMNKEVLVVHMDDFIHRWQDRKKWMDEAKDQSQVFEFQWYRYEALEKLITTFKQRSKGTLKLKTYDFDRNAFDLGRRFDLSKNILVIDGIFLFHPQHSISKMWDQKIYLHVDFARGDKRRIAREKKRWGKNFIPDNQPGSYALAFKEAYKRYVETYHPDKKADVVF